MLRALSRAGRSTCFWDGSWSPRRKGMGMHGDTLTSDPLSPQRWADVEQLLHSQGIGLLIAHHGHIVKTVEVGQCLPKEMALSTGCWHLQLGSKDPGPLEVLGDFTAAREHRHAVPRHSILRKHQAQQQP